MKTKKTRDANLERKRVPFLFLGLVVACGLTLSAFEWRTFEKSPKVPSEGSIHSDLPDEQIFVAVPMKKPKPRPKQRKVVDEMILVEEVNKMDIELDIPDFEEEVDPVPLDIAPITENIEEEKVILPSSEIMPAFPGGFEARQRFLHDNLTYPDIAKDAGMEGTVWVRFVVNERGEIVNAEIVKSRGASLDEEALRVIKLMPKWKPGKQNGRPVSVIYHLPIKYSLIR
jgi:protein TonB